MLLQQQRWLPQPEMERCAGRRSAAHAVASILQLLECFAIDLGWLCILLLPEVLLQGTAAVLQMLLMFSASIAFT
jgi:hypothetical protein